MEKIVYFNVKPSNRVREEFVREYPDAICFGSASLGSKSKTYALPREVYERDRVKLMAYGTKARQQ